CTGKKAGGSDTVSESVSSGVRVAPDGIRGDNSVLDVPSLGVLTGNGVIASDNSLDFKMLLKLSSSANNMLGSLTGISASTASRGLPFLIQGKTSNPVFRPALGESVKRNLQDTLTQALQGNKGPNQNDAQGQQNPDLKGALAALP